MIFRCLAAPLVLLGASTIPTAAASFDCSKASTPFEKAICEFPDLSAADDLLAKSFATATGGLTKESVVLMRQDQREWLDYAQIACTDDAKPLTSGRYDDVGGSCLASIFAQRSKTLEQSRMLAGHRFFIKSYYVTLPDPNEVDNPDSYWKLATHQLVLPLLDADHPLATRFNDYLTGQAENKYDILVLSEGGDIGDIDASSDSSINMVIKEVVGANRITLSVDTSWYGHGAAHGNWGTSYLHYNVAEDRGLIAGDIFTGDNWAGVLTEAAWAQLQLEHSEWLQVDSAGDIAETVVEPTRWDLSDDYGLVIQFQPYEVAAYAYGAPTITIPWDKLDAIKADTQDSIRYGH